jgi:type IV secretion system protein VirB8
MWDSEDSFDYEASLKYIIEKSNKRAWTISYISLLVAIVFALLYFFNPIKVPVPFMAKVEKQTGLVTIQTSVNKNNLTGLEAVAKHFASSYVKKREGYYFHLLEQDFFYVQLHSSTNVAKGYRTIYDGSEHSRDKILKDNYIVEPKLISVVLGKSAGVPNATIRLVLNTINAQSMDIERSEKKIVTLSYKYVAENKLTEEEILANPLGFKVITYRIDDEIM